MHSSESGSHNAIPRCPWAANVKPFYQAYHDTEWGVPVHDDRILFEMLILEGAQAGLSWETILLRRENYRRLYHNFDPQKVSSLTDSQLDIILTDSGIIRHRLKVFAARKNAKIFLKIQKEFGSFDNYIWKFVGGIPLQPHLSRHEANPGPEIAALISKDLKKRGMTFVGSTIMYAYMQAVGLINDHSPDCFRHGDLIP